MEGEIYFFGYDQSEAQAKRVTDYADRALHLQPDLSEAHLAAVKEAFDQTIAHLQAQAADMPTPPSPPAQSAPSAMLSAPVSRMVPTGPGARPRGKITLSPSEVEAARISGLTVEQYAAEKLKYEGMRERGEYRDNRER